MRKTLLVPYLLSSMAALIQPPALAQPASSFSILGHEEPVTLFPGAITAQARLDTGATRSSLHAERIGEQLKDGQAWVRFTFVNERGESTVMTRPIEKRIRVRQVSGIQRRYVITLGVCLGPHFHEAEFTLADRSGMAFPVLIGRNILSQDLLVNSALRNSLSPECSASVPFSWRP